MTALSEPIKEEDRDHPRARERWFLSGRTVLGESAAGLRYKAHQQKMRMRTARAARLKAQSTPVPLSSTSAGWIPLGPVPLASDASGVGIQDYGPVSGRATSVAIDPADSSGNTVFIGGAYGGVWKSTNAGSLSVNSPGSVSWTPVTDDQASLAVGAIAIQPGNNNPANSVVLVGTGEANSSGDSYYGVGILRSADGGNTWNLVPSGDAGTHPFLGLGFTKIAFSIATPNLVVAASAASSVGVVNGAINNSTRGLYTSTDGGQTWSLRLPTDPSGQPVSPSASATSVVFNPGTGFFYAAIRYHGLYSSPDGLSWFRMASQPGGANLSLTACPTALANPPSCPFYRGEFAIVPGRNEMYVWYVDANEKDQGIWQSTNGGSSWVQISDTGITNCGESNGCGTEQGAYNLELAAVPNGSGTDLYAGAINIFKCAINSSNATCSGKPFINLTHVYGCSSIAKVHPDQHGVAFVLSSGKALMYFANDGGIYRAADGFALTTGTCGGTNPFESLNVTLGSMTQFVAFSQHPTDANTLLGGTQDNGSPATSQATTNPGWSNVNSGDGGYNAITPSSTSDWFVSNPDVPPEGLEIDHCSLGIGCHTGDFANGAVVKSVQLGNDDGDFYFPYILDPQSDHEILVGTCRVWRGGPSTSSTGSYTALSNNFETLSNATCTGNEVNTVRGLAAGGAKSGGFSNVVYATTNGTGPSVSPAKGGAVWATINAAGGPAAFKNVTGPTNPGHFNFSSVAIDPSDATGNTAYITIMGFHVSHVFKTTNAGQSWTDFTGTGSTALPDAPANAVVVDAGSSPGTGTVYVGTDVGVFSSSTGSPSWTEVGPPSGFGTPDFLPNVAVTALKIFNTATSKRLRASTYGRGVWEFILFAGPDYVISISDTPQSIFPGQSATFHGTLSALNGYASPVTLTCSGTTPPACSPSPSSTTPTQTGIPFTVTTGTINSVSSFSFNVHGVGSDTNTVTHDTAALLQVVDFAIGAPSPASVQIAQGFSSQPIQVQLSGVGAFDGTVNLSCSSATAGVSCTFSNPSPSVTSSSPATVNVTVITSNTTPLGGASVTISATVAGAPAAKTKNLPITVTSSGFAMVLAKASLNILDGKAGTFTGTLTAQNGYANTVNINCLGTPPSTCTSSPVTLASNSQTFTVNVANSVPGNFAFNIQAVGGDGFTQVLPVSLVVAQNFTVTVNNSTQTTPAGQTATYTLSVAPAGNAFSNPVLLSCNVTPAAGAAASGPPPTCSLNPTQVTPGSSAASVILKVGTTAPVALMHRHGLFYAAWLPLPGIIFIFAGLAGSSQPRRSAMRCVTVGLISLFMLSLSACGGGGSSTGGPPPPVPGTAGTYTITVTATAVGLAPQSLPVTLVVQ